MTTQPPTGLEFSRTTRDAIIALRHRVLREGLPIEAACWPEDLIDGSCHFAAFTLNQAHEAVCCASFIAGTTWDTHPAYQLRGMATAPECRGRGIGSAFLAWCENAILLGTEIRMLWCNARVSAIPFYEKHGWDIYSAEFDIPSAGPHRKMAKSIVE